MFEKKESKKQLVGGIDVAKEKHYACLDGNGEKPFAFSNNREGLRELLNQIRLSQKHLGLCEDDPVVIGLEPTGHYWKALGYALKQEKGIELKLVNPYHTKLSKELRDNSPLKSDPKDSRLVKDLTAEGKTLEEHLLEGPYANLRRYYGLWRYLSEKAQRIRNRLEALLNEHFPEYENCFVDLLGATSRKLLERYGFPWKIVEGRFCGLERLIVRESRGKCDEEKAKKIWDLAWDSLGHGEGKEAAELELKLLLKEFKGIEGEQEVVKSAMAKELKYCEESSYILSFPGVCTVTAAGFLGETGALSAYKSVESLEKLAGINLVECSSGNHLGQRKFSKRGRAELRHIVYMIAIVAIGKNLEFREIYQKKIASCPGKAKMKIVGSMMAKVLRVLFTLGKHHLNYDGKKICHPPVVGMAA